MSWMENELRRIAQEQETKKILEAINKRQEQKKEQERSKAYHQEVAQRADQEIAVLESVGAVDLLQDLQEKYWGQHSVLSTNFEKAWNEGATPWLKLAFEYPTYVEPRSGYDWEQEAYMGIAEQDLNIVYKREYSISVPSRNELAGRRDYMYSPTTTAYINESNIEVHGILRSDKFYGSTGGIEIIKDLSDSKRVNGELRKYLAIDWHNRIQKGLTPEQLIERQRNDENLQRFLKEDNDPRWDLFRSNKGKRKWRLF